MSKLRVAAYQMSVGPDIEANWQRIESGVERAASGGAQLVALPECAVSGYPPLHHNTRADIDVGLIADTNRRIARLADKSGIWVVVGSIAEEDGQLYNCALVYSDDGELVLRYNKLHLMPDDKRFFTPGWSPVWFRMNDLMCGTLICYDARFPEPFRQLRDEGARLIINISNACGGDTWKAPVLEGTYRARASENSCFVVAVSAAGPLQMATSRICSPLGLDLASANQDREELIFADIDPSEADTGYYYDKRRDIWG